MKKYISTRTIDSALKDFQGVSFTILRLSDRRRERLDEALAPHKQQIRDLLNESLDFDEQKQLEKQPQEPSAQITRIGLRLQELRARMDAIKAQMDRKTVEWGLVSINGLEIDEQPATVEQLIEAGEWDLYNEILAAVQKEARLTVAEVKNSESPTTSPAPVAGRTDSSTVQSAGAQDISGGATVPDSSPTK